MEAECCLISKSTKSQLIVVRMGFHISKIGYFFQGGGFTKKLCNPRKTTNDHQRMKKSKEQVLYLIFFAVSKYFAICRFSLLLWLDYYKVNRCLARAPQPPTNPPTRNEKSRQGLAQNDQKCQFRAKFGRVLAKNPTHYPHYVKTHRHLVCIVFWSGMGRLPKNDQIWLKVGIFGHFGPGLSG